MRNKTKIIQYNENIIKNIIKKGDNCLYIDEYMNKKLDDFDIEI